MSRVLVLLWPIILYYVVGSLPSDVVAFSAIVIGVSYLLSTFFELVNCLYEGDVLVTIAMTSTRTSGVYTSGEVAVGESEMQFVSGSGACPEAGTLAGSFALSPVQTIRIE